MNRMTRPIVETAEDAYRLVVKTPTKRAGDTLTVRCYWNLHKKMWSIKYRGKVVAHAHEVHVMNARGLVSQGGRRQVLKSKRKNVHAFVVGDICVFPHDLVNRILADGRRITYNPYKWDRFMCHKQIHEWDLLHDPGLKDTIEKLPWMGDKACVLRGKADVKGLSDVSERDIYYTKKGGADDFV